MKPLNEFTLGVPAMDDAHRGLFYMLAQLQDASDEEFMDGSQELMRALEADLRAEDELMAQHAYEGREAHVAEHARIMACLHHAMEAEDRCQARRAMRLLPIWLQAHMNTLDVKLAAALAA